MNDELSAILGKYEELVEKLQEKYGIAKDEARHRVDEYKIIVELHLKKFWSRNVTITTRLANAVSTLMLLKIVQSVKLQPRQLITHHFALNEIMKTYDIF